jgi:hypothetical protein
MYNKVNILQKIGWYQDVEQTAHDKLTDLFNCMVDYFSSRTIHNGEFIPNDIYVGGYYPMNPQSSFSNVIKRGHRYIEPSNKSMHLAYCAYCNFLQSPSANQIASDTTLFINNTLEGKLIDEFISKTYGQIF